MQHVFDMDVPPTRELFRFDSPASLEPFRLMTDQDMGGKSRATFTYDSDAECAVFEGELDLTPAPGVDNSGFAAIVTRDSVGQWELDGYDALMLDAKTDGRLYVTNIKAPSVVEGDMWQSYTQGEAGTWKHIVLPFARFIVTQRGFVEGQIALDPRMVESVGILMAQRRGGPFRLELRSINAIDTSRVNGMRWTGLTRT